MLVNAINVKLKYFSSFVAVKLAKKSESNHMLTKVLYHTTVRMVELVGLGGHRHPKFSSEM